MSIIILNKCFSVVHVGQLKWQSIHCFYGHQNHDFQGVNAFWLMYQLPKGVLHQTLDFLKATFKYFQRILLTLEWLNRSFKMGPQNHFAYIFLN